MKWLLVFLLASPFAFAQESAAPSKAEADAKRLERTLRLDIGPICKIKKKRYYMEADQEEKCREKGGSVVTGPRKRGMKPLNTIEQFELRPFRPSGRPIH